MGKCQEKDSGVWGKKELIVFMRASSLGAVSSLPKATAWETILEATPDLGICKLVRVWQVTASEAAFRLKHANRRTHTIQTEAG